jgi:ribonuclease HII
MPKGDSRKEEGGLLAGLDEVGRGCVAGPMCVAVVAFPRKMPPIGGVKDSKKVSEKKRMELAPKIVEAASFVGLGWVTPAFIDEHGMTKAWQTAAMEALEGLNADILLIDGRDRVYNYKGKQNPIIKGDEKHWQIGAASIVAKVSRDIHMIDMAVYYPEYNWAQNKGYGSKEHLAAILEHGVNQYHRKSFLKKNRKIVQKWLKKKNPAK